MIFIRRSAAVFLLSLLVTALVGCGEKTVTVASGSKLEQSQKCFDSQCHSSTTSPVTARVISEEWQLSRHNTSNAAGCIDCHFLDAADAQPHMDRVCGRCHSITPIATSHTGLPPNAIRNPDSYGMCGKCHTAASGYSISTYDGSTNNTLTSHFSTPLLAAYTSGKFKARYVTKDYEKNCRACHNPHDTSSKIDILRQWARSGKGNPSALPWTDYDFRTRGTTTPGASPATSFGTDCVRCHTATGHIAYLASKSIAPFGGSSKVEGKEVLACNVCHDNYSYSRRQVPQVTAYYNKSTVSKMRIRITKTYADVGESNLCLNCHVGRETGQIIKELALPVLTANKVMAPTAAYDFTNASFENSHYLTAGATVFRTSGFEFYSSQYYANPTFYAHDQIGVANYKNTGTSGPCITCHMSPARHTFLPVARDANGNATSLVSTACNNSQCHNGSMSAAEIEHQKTLFNAAMDALKAILQEKLAIYFYNANPYFFASAYDTAYKETYTGASACSKNQPVKNWQTAGTSTFTPKITATSKSCISATNASGISGSGPNNMGAAFNYNMLYHDFGAFTHNRYYAKRLIYDSISWLYDNNIRVTSNLAGYYSDVEAAIQTNTLLTQAQKDLACDYLFSSTSKTSPYTYAQKNSRNWRPGSSSTSPVY